MLGMQAQNSHKVGLLPCMRKQDGRGDNMRLIDADALLADVGEEPFNWTDTPEEIREVSDYKYYVGLIKNAPTIEAEPARWINMDEDEPPLGQKVLVYRAQKPVEIMSMLYQDNEYWWRNDVDEIFKIYDNDYWMPIPEPPKEVNE